MTVSQSFLASYRAHFKKPVIAMKIASTPELSDRAVITCVQTDNNNKTKGKFQAEQREGLEQSRIKIRERKQAQNEFNRRSNGEKGRKHINQLHEGPYNADVQ